MDSVEFVDDRFTLDRSERQVLAGLDAGVDDELCHIDGARLYALGSSGSESAPMIWASSVAGMASASFRVNAGFDRRLTM